MVPLYAVFVVTWMSAFAPNRGQTGRACGSERETSRQCVEDCFGSFYTQPIAKSQTASKRVLMRKVPWCHLELVSCYI